METSIDEAIRLRDGDWGSPMTILLNSISRTKVRRPWPWGEANRRKRGNHQWYWVKRAEEVKPQTNFKGSLSAEESHLPTQASLHQLLRAKKVLFDMRQLNSRVQKPWHSETCIIQPTQLGRNLSQLSIIRPIYSRLAILMRVLDLFGFVHMIGASNQPHERLGLACSTD